ncbi:MAG TPA: SMP-30/gluconolactonase/LRE family protein [Candidatus Cloacimonadota bacterium]|nr:SMP-30/gluconolactonase/LRE family protein [Candidatus Cloacimonadota bacterium]
MNKKLKKYALILAIVLVLLLALIIYIKSLGVKSPESIAFDGQNNRFLVSGTKSKTIYSMEIKGKVRPFLKKGFKAPKGLLVSGPYLYVADQTVLHTIDIPGAKIINSYPLEGAVGLNDIAMDNAGKLYITDLEGSAVYIVEPSTRKTLRLTEPLIDSPNGIVYDGPRQQMLIVSFKKQSPILSLNTETMKVSKFMDTVSSNLDGIAIDGLGRIYFSSWQEKAVYVIPQEQNRIEIFKSEIISPADIYYHQPTNQLLVPLWEKNKIKRFKLD